MTGKSKVDSVAGNSHRTGLRAAARRTWKSSRVFVAVTVTNAIIQSLLIVPRPIFGINTGLFVFLGLVSYITLVASLTIMVGAALASGNGPNTVRAAYEQMRPHLFRFLAATVVLTAAAIVGLLFWTYPGLLILAVTPYVLIAAADGHEHPIRANFEAIKCHFGRYIGLLVVTVVLLTIMFLASAALTFFVDGAPAAFLIWLYLGFVGCWLITGWVLLWRSTPPGHVSRVAKD